MAQLDFQLARKRVAAFFASNPSCSVILLYNGDSPLRPSANFHYYSGAEQDNAVFIAIKNREPMLVVSELNSAEAEEHTPYHIIPYERGKIGNTLKKILSEKKQICFSENDLSFSFYQLIKSAAPKAKFLPSSKKFRLQRMIKEKGEIDSICASCKLALDSIEDVKIAPEKTEKQLNHELLLAICKRGSVPSFSPIILIGERARFPHGRPSQAKLEKNFTLVVDWGAEYKFYCSDFTRCYSGKAAPHPRNFLPTCESLKQICEETADYARPGMAAKELSEYANRLIMKAGFPEMPHAIGHGIGLEVHEYPSFAKKSDHVLEENTIFTIEPGFYGKKFGARYENTCILTNKGAKPML